MLREPCPIPLAKWLNVIDPLTDLTGMPSLAAWI
jgi:formylmethanofuran dehydrogenase subunit D